jgi:hypothetical protein
MVEEQRRFGILDELRYLPGELAVGNPYFVDGGCHKELRGE